MYYCPATPRYFPLIICHVSMQISIHWLRTGYRILSPIKDIENCNCQLEFIARSRLSNPLGRLPIVQGCTLFHANAIGFFSRLIHIFSQYFLLNFYGNLQWTRRAFGIVAVIPGPTVFDGTNNCQKVVVRGDPLRDEECGVSFLPANLHVRTAIGIVIRLATCWICEKWKMQFTLTSRRVSYRIEGVSALQPPRIVLLQHLPNSVCKFKRCGH